MISRKKLLAYLGTPVALLSVGGMLAFNNPNEQYFEIAKNLDIFATLFKEINTYYVDDVNPSKAIKTGIDAMLGSLDPYTNYIPEDEIEDYRTMTTGQYGGIGAVISQRNGKVIVMMPYEGFPANKSGMRIADELLEVDGIDVTKKNTGDVSKLLKGQAGTKLKIKIKRFGEKDTRLIELTRERIKIDNVPYHGMVTADIGYLRLTDFTSDAGKEVRKAIVDLKEKGAKKIIFDLRDNPGGLLNEAVNISNLFIDKDKEVVSTKGKVVEWNKSYKALNAPLDKDIPVVVLTSGRSASASEIVGGVIQDYDRGVLIGQKTYGKGLVQTTRMLSYNSQLKVTTAKYYIPSGRCIQAIDYKNRNADGSVGKFADSLKVAFKTTNGRIVYDGGGVAPDIAVERTAYAPITISLENKGLFFDYATEYFYSHPSIAPAKEFKVSDADYAAFVTWLKNKEYDYTTKLETTLKDLEEVSKKEKYFDDIKDRLENLKGTITHNKELDLTKHKAEIKEVLEAQIVSRYYFEKGVTEASFNNDPEIQEAVKLFGNMTKYKEILSGKAAKK